MAHVGFGDFKVQKGSAVSGYLGSSFARRAWGV